MPNPIEDKLSEAARAREAEKAARDDAVRLRAEAAEKDAAAEDCKRRAWKLETEAHISIVTGGRVVEIIAQPGAATDRGGWRIVVGDAEVDGAAAADLIDISRRHVDACHEATVLRDRAAQLVRAATRPPSTSDRCMPGEMVRPIHTRGM